MPLAHERLIVYQRSIELVAWAGELLETLPVKIAAKDQLDRASTSVPLNIAEGNGKFSTKDRARFLQIALGSALECAACLDVLVARRLKTAEEVKTGKAMVDEVVSMLFSLLDRLECRVGEEEENYAAGDLDR